MLNKHYNYNDNYIKNVDIYLVKVYNNTKEKRKESDFDGYKYKGF